MATITDEYMREMITKTKEYSVVLLKPGPKTDQENAQKIIWEHGRRNFQLRADGVMSIVGPIIAKGDLSGFAIFNTDPEAAKIIMDGDPAVMAGIFIYEVYPCRSFPGDGLPA